MSASVAAEFVSLVYISLDLVFLILFARTKVVEGLPELFKIIFIRFDSYSSNNDSII